MEDASNGYKVPIIFILMSVVFISAVVVSVPLISKIPSKDSKSFHIYVQDGLIFKRGENAPYTGQVLDTIENKIIAYEVVNGLKNGQFSISNLHGNFTVSGYVENNKNVGTWKYFYDDGLLESIGSFKDDKPHGNWRWFYKNGKVKSEGNYLLGKPEGIWIKYDEKGNLNLMINYSDGEIVSEVKFHIPQSV